MSDQLRPPPHPPRLQDRVCVVTGASSGLGRAIALLYAAHGAKLVVCVDIHPDPPEAGQRPTHDEIQQLYGPAIFVNADVTKSEDMKRVVDTVVQTGGRLDVMVNNAGIGTRDRNVRLHQLDDKEWDKADRYAPGPLATARRDVNLRGVYLGCKYALQQFLAQQPTSTGRRGWIVNTSSMLGYVGLFGGAGPYCASKGGVLNLTKQIAVDYAKDKIHCNALCPGFTKTAMTKSTWAVKESHDRLADMTPWGEWGLPEDVAKGALFLATDDAAFVTGIGLPVDGGYLAQ